MCTRKQCVADNDVSSYTNEDINSNSRNKFSEHIINIKLKLFVLQ